MTKLLILSDSHNSRLAIENILAAEARGAEVALFGHTHVPVAEQHGSVFLFNPGSCGRCYTGPNTYGILTLDKGRIVHYEHKEVPHP